MQCILAGIGAVLDFGMIRCSFCYPTEACSLAGREHGRSIPFSDILGGRLNRPGQTAVLMCIEQGRVRRLRGAPPIRDIAVGDGRSLDAPLTKTSSIYLAGKAPS